MGTAWRSSESKQSMVKGMLIVVIGACNGWVWFMAPIYVWKLPTKQARLLKLWDEFGIPHEERK